MRNPRLRLLLVRHGQADGNAHGAFLGHRDDGLTDLGREQISSLRDRLSDRAVDAVISSPLRRARESAEILAAGFGLTPQIEAGFMEQDYGRWDGVPFGEVRTRFPQDFEAWMSGDPDIGPTQGETLNQMAARVFEAYERLTSDVDSGKTLMLVSHAGALQSLVCRLLKTDLCNQWPYMLQTGTMTEIEVHGYGCRMIRMSW